MRVRIQRHRTGLTVHTYRWSLCVIVIRRGRRPAIWVDLFDLYAD